MTKKKLDLSSFGVGAYASAESERCGRTKVRQVVRNNGINTPITLLLVDSHKTFSGRSASHRCSSKGLCLWIEL